MKRPTIATLGLSLGSVWLAVCPLLLLLSILPPQQIIQEYNDYGRMMPNLSEPFVSMLSRPLVTGVALFVSVGLILLEWRAQVERRRFVGQIIIIVIWQFLMLISFLGYSLSTFKMGEIVTDEMIQVRNEIRIKHKASQPTYPPYSSPREMQGSKR